MAPRIIPFSVDSHREAFFEMNMEFLRWSHEQILVHHGIDMSSGQGGNASEFVESMFDELIALEPPAGIIFVLEIESNLAGMGLIKTIGEGV